MPEQIAATSPVTLFRAAWVAPMSAPLISDGAVLVRGGTIVDVGAADVLLHQQVDAVVQDLGNVVLMPGLVNAHVHLELSDLRPGEPPASFVDWLLGVIRKGPVPTPEGEARVTAATQTGIEQSFRFGVTTVGDITRFPHITRQALANSRLRAISFGEVTAMAARRHLLEPRLAAATAASPAPDRVISAVSPHAPYSIELPGYQQCVERAIELGVPVATHLAESADEAAFLQDLAGPFRKLWDAIGGLDDAVPTVAGGPIELARRAGLLSYDRSLLVHMNYVDDAAMDELSQSNASVVLCPRTHRYFGHPPHRWRQMLNRGINVAVGTDSTASSPNLNLVDDLRLLHEQSPDVPVQTLWQLATTRAAKALGWKGIIGELVPEAAADLIAFAVATNDPLREVLENATEPSNVWIAGKTSGVEAVR